MARGTEREPRAPQSLESDQSAEGLGDSTVIEGKESEFPREFGQPAPSAPLEGVPNPVPSEKPEDANQPKAEIELTDLKEHDPTQLEASMESIFSSTAEEQ